MTKKTRSVFVIGGTGSVGGLLLRLLSPYAAAGSIRLKAGARSAAGAEAIRGHGAEPVPFDMKVRLIDLPTYIEALTGVDDLFLLTPYTVDMLIQSKSVVDAAVAAGVEHIVHLGLLAQPNTVGIHQAWHEMIEVYIEHSGMSWTHLHPNVFMTNFPSFQRINGVYPLPERGTGVFKGFLKPDIVCSWIAPEDIARAAAAVLLDTTRHRNVTYRLAVEALSFAQLVALASDIMQRDFVYEVAPIEVLKRALAASTMEEKYAESGINTMELVNRGMLTDFADVHDDFQRLTGTDPILWREMIRLHPEWFGRGPTSLLEPAARRANA